MLRQTGTISTGTNAIKRLAFSPDGTRLAFVGGYGGGRVHLLSGENWKRLGIFKGWRQGTRELAFVGNSQRLLAFGLDGIVRRFEFDDRALSMHAYTPPERNAAALAVTEDGNFFATGNRDGRISLWKRESGSPAAFGQATGQVNSLAFSPSGNALVSGGGIEGALSELHLWEVSSQKRICEFKGHSDWVLWVGFSRDGRYLASGSYGEILFWEVESRKLIRSLRRPASARFSTVSFTFTRHEDLFVSAGWSHEERSEKVRDAAGRVLGWNSKRAGLLQLWRLSSGRLLECVHAHERSVSLAGCIECGCVASGGGEGTIKLWHVDEE